MQYMRVITEGILNFYAQLKERFPRKHDVFTENELKNYEDLTVLNRVEIVRLYNQFVNFSPSLEYGEKNPVLPPHHLCFTPALRMNPFKDRIVKVFTTEEGEFSFEDYLNMMSVFSDKASVIVKSDYAFRINDFDDDGLISRNDLLELLKRIKGNNELSKSECEEIIQNVLAEADLNADGYIAYPEFEHLVLKSPDFLNSFRIRL
ncbi:calcium and integrin-binding protein 1-like [Stegodyphus dumicola]|uniref:calcium and integrin-binding protein 1-like n=1 Tax=Stegodyphus dumicola TaxID=202533 RepID=UPI0015A8A67B|nr:calcium and integrin-binding protein 1-like [Stegodyphus dumicola]